MASALDIAALDARALGRRHDVLARIVLRGTAYHADRLSNEIRSLGPNAPRLPGLHVKIDEAGRRSAHSDSGSISGRGFTSLVASLADVSVERASAWLAHLPELAEPRA